APASSADLTDAGRRSPAPRGSVPAVDGERSSSGRIDRKLDRKRGARGELRRPLRPFDQDDGGGVVEQPELVGLSRIGKPVEVRVEQGTELRRVGLDERKGRRRNLGVPIADQRAD